MLIVLPLQYFIEGGIVAEFLALNHLRAEVVLFWLRLGSYQLSRVQYGA